MISETINNKNTLPRLSIPRTEITSGAHANGGTGLYNSINGSKNPFANLFSPMNKPRGTPTIIPKIKPRKTLRNESQICPVGTGTLIKSKSPVTKLKTLLLNIRFYFTLLIVDSDTLLASYRQSNQEE
ncbi:MAG: hypothetical protein ACJZ3C_04535 [Pelagibacteraceae bacterium]